MEVLVKLCLFTHIRMFIMFLFVVFFTFIFSFEAEQCSAWTILRTNNMSCFTLLRLLDGCSWILVFIFFLTIDTCYVKGWKIAHWIFACKKDKFTTSIVFISNIVCLGLHCFYSLSLSFCSLLVISRLLFGFPTFFLM
jgi:hypothetical protein